MPSSRYENRSPWLPTKSSSTAQSLTLGQLIAPRFVTMEYDVVVHPVKLDKILCNGGGLQIQDKVPQILHSKNSGLSPVCYPRHCLPVSNNDYLGSLPPQRSNRLYVTGAAIAATMLLIGMMASQNEGVRTTLSQSTCKRCGPSSFCVILDV